MTPKKYDEIGPWSEIKLEIIQKYTSAYLKILNKNASIKNILYIDAFAGAGKVISRRSGKLISGSPRIALEISPKFTEYHFIDLNKEKISELRELARNRTDVHVHEGDCNTVLVDTIFSKCKYEDFSRALCLLDPYALDVDWKVLQYAGNQGTIEIFYNFMIMDANRNIFWHESDKVSGDELVRMDRAWGDRSWRDVVYRKVPTLFGDIEQKAENRLIAEAFRKRLKEVAGFEYVPEPIPMRNANNSVVYYLYFASPNKTANKIVSDIFKKYRKMGVQ